MDTTPHRRLAPPEPESSDDAGWVIWATVLPIAINVISNEIRKTNVVAARVAMSGGKYLTLGNPCIAFDLDGAPSGFGTALFMDAIILVTSSGGKTSACDIMCAGAQA
jgi:hypothetical protein